jgi:hypothetical protein
MKTFLMLLLGFCGCGIASAAELPTSVHGISLGASVTAVREVYENCSDPINEFTEGYASVICNVDEEKVIVGYFEGNETIVSLGRLVDAEVSLVEEQLTEKYGQPNKSRTVDSEEVRYWRRDNIRLLAVDFTLFTTSTLVEITDMTAYDARQRKTTQDALEWFE